MFDKTVVQSGPSVVRHYEYRAPTDESIKIFSELEEKAKNRVIDSFPISNNLVSGEVIIFDNMHLGSKECVLAFKINGKSFKVSKVLSHTQYYANAMEYKSNSNFMRNWFCEEISKEIVKELTQNFIKW